MSVNTAPNSFYDPEEEANQWFDEKHPNASCHKCDKKLCGATVHMCGGAGGACETWFCEDCKVINEEEGEECCTVCREEEDQMEEDDWVLHGMEIYSQHEDFKKFCGTYEHLVPYHGFTYYQCWGGGPEGGYIENDEGTIFRVERTWCRPFTVEPMEGRLEIKDRDGVMQLRVVPRSA